MCTVCGCGEGQVKVAGHDHDHHHHDHEHHHDHDHDHGPVASGDDLHYGHGPAHAHAPGLSQARMVTIEQDILAKNNDYARANRERFESRGVLALNLVSSPGSGKTSLLVETLKCLEGSFPRLVIEGDQQTTFDAERVRETGVPTVQINTGKGCHLDAHMVGHALARLALESGAVLFIENVGNLVCPAGFDLGERCKVVILSVTEGEDKPLKYPDMFAAAELMILGKVDLLPHVDFDVDRCLEYARRVNPAIQCLQLSARSGAGMDGWLDWLRGERRTALEARSAALEAELARVRGELAI